MTAAAVDAHVAALSGLRRDRMAAVVALARAVPGIAEGIEWDMPVFRRDGRFFAAKSRAAYLSLYFDTREDVAGQVAVSGPGLKHGKACVNVTARAALPEDAVRAALAMLFG